MRTGNAGKRPSAANDSRSGGRVGYTVGGGVEWAVSDKWSAKLEYQYFDFGPAQLNATCGGSADVDIDAHTVKIGVNPPLIGPRPGWRAEPFRPRAHKTGAGCPGRSGNL